MLGNVEIQLPIPVGFAPPSRTPAMLRGIIEHGLPVTNRFVALLMPEDFFAARAAGEKPHMSRYYLVQTFRQFEDDGMSQADFDKVKDIFRRQAGAAFDAAASEVTAGEGRMASDASSLTGDKSIALHMGSTKQLGIFDEQANSMSLAMLTPMSFTDRNGSRQSEQASATVIILMDGKPLEMSVYADYRSQADVDWVKSAAREWLQQFSALNPPMPAK